MKASELIKHLEDGGEITSNDWNRPHNMEDVLGNINLLSILNHPNNYKIVIPKVTYTIDLFATDVPICSLGYTLYDWVGTTLNRPNGNNTKKVGITVEEL